MDPIVPDRLMWLERDWRMSRTGNIFVRSDRHTFGVFRKDDGWTGFIRKVGSMRVHGTGVFLEGVYVTADEAKLALFDLFYLRKPR